MQNIIQKIFLKKPKKSFINKGFSDLRKIPEVIRIFATFENFDESTEIRFVGGCVRKILNNEKFDDIDLAINVEPKIVKSILEKNNINFYETGIEHGTITALINNKKFEITSLRNDVSTDGRHAVVEFSNDWKIDATRRDFTINSIYSDLDGNLFDPFDGKKDLNLGIIKFIGDTEKRINEDYLRILRYLRFFISYSKNAHDNKTKTIIRKNIAGIKNISKERLLDELKKIFLTFNFDKLFNDKFCVEILTLIFPEIKNLYIFKNLNDEIIELLKQKDFIFFLSLAIIDETDNANYFLFKYNISKTDVERILFLKNNFKNIHTKNFFNEMNLKRIFYKTNKQFLIDLIDFKICKSIKTPHKILKLKNNLSQLHKPLFPIKAKYLIDNYGLKEGKILGQKLMKLEEIWLSNDFKITQKDIEAVVQD